MIAYVDASVVLRVLLGEPGRLREWRQLETAVSSALAEVELLRTLDAIHLATALAWREARHPGLIVATHDPQLALAARACGFEVVGVAG